MKTVASVGLNVAVCRQKSIFDRVKSFFDFSGRSHQAVSTAVSGAVISGDKASSTKNDVKAKKKKRNNILKPKKFIRKGWLQLRFDCTFFNGNRIR